MSREGNKTHVRKGRDQRRFVQQDIKRLHGLGYAQELFREMGGFSNFAISFTIISILTGAISTYGFAVGAAGPAGSHRWMAAGLDLRRLCGPSDG